MASKDLLGIFPSPGVPLPGDGFVEGHLSPIGTSQAKEKGVERLGLLTRIRGPPWYMYKHMVFNEHLFGEIKMYGKAEKVKQEPPLSCHSYKLFI